MVIGNIFDTCYVNMEITGGTGIGECTFIGNILGTATSAKALDTGNVKSFYYNNKNYLTYNYGATSCADGGTIAHGLATTPLMVNASTSVASEIVSVTALSTTTFTCAIKKISAGVFGPGTTQTIYWHAWV